MIGQGEASAHVLGDADTRRDLDEDDTRKILEESARNALGEEEVQVLDEDDTRKILGEELVRNALSEDDTRKALDEKTVRGHAGVLRVPRFFLPKNLIPSGFGEIQ
jgi:hypothetical protein